MVNFFVLFFSLLVCFPFQAKTAPLRIYLKFEPPAEEVYIGQETGFKITLYDRIGLDNVVLDPPKLPNADLFLLQNKPIRFQSETNGMEYDANELEFSLVPKSAGKMEFPPFCLSASAPTMISARDLPGNVSLNDNGELLVCTDPFEINVNRLPESPVPLFAASDVAVYDGIVPKTTEVRIGTPIKRSLLLSATGTIPAFLPDFRTDPIENAKVYNGKVERSQPPTPSNLKAAVRGTLVIIPQEEGSLVLPEVKVPWLNVQTGKIQTSVIPSRTLTVLPLDGTEKESEAPLAGREEKQPDEGSFCKKRTAFFLSVFAIGFLIFSLFVKIFRRGRYRQSLIDNVEDACLAGNAEEIEAALLAWAVSFFPESRFLSLSDVRDFFQGKNEEFVQCLEDLELYLYGTGRFAKHLPTAKENLGKEICDSFKKVRDMKIRRKRTEKKVLPNLYPDDFTSS